MGRPKLSAAEKARRKAERESGKVTKAPRASKEQFDVAGPPTPVDPPRDMFLMQKVLELSVICNQQAQKIDALSGFANTMQVQVNQALTNLVNRLQVLEKEVLPAPAMNMVPPGFAPQQAQVPQDQVMNHVVNEKDDLGLS